MNQKIFRRKTVAGIAALSLLCTSAAVPSILSIGADAANTNATGDLNNDGTVTAADVAVLQNALLGTSTLTQEQYANANVCDDGRVNGLDLAKLRQMAAGTDPVSDAIAIHLSDSGIQVEGDTKGVTAVSGKTVTISASGNYLVDGTITDGQILIAVPDITADANSVDLYLQDVTMTSTAGAPCILAQSADKVKLTCGGTTTLTDTATTANLETSGVIYADCDLTVTKNSTGTLQINSSMNNAMYSKDDIKLNGGTIVVNTDADTTSDADAIRANNTITVDGAIVSIDSSADGIKSSKEDVVIASGKLNIKAGNDAIQAATAITVSGGTVIAGGDRGFTLDAGGALNITGGDVLATATDNAFGEGITVNTAGCTQGVASLSYTEEWKKGNAIVFQKSGKTVAELTPIKKFSYALVSTSGMDSSSTYQLYTGGTQMQHSNSAAGQFQMSGALTGFTGVTAMAGGSVITPSDDNTATALTYSDSSITAYNAAGNSIASPTNVTISGTTATVTVSSEIAVSGSCQNGQLIVDVDKTAEPEGLVTLSLADLTLSNSSAAPIYVASIGNEAVISAKNGTENVISDGTTHTDTYTDSEGNTETVNAAIFSRDDLKIKGKGALTVNGNTEDGIACANDLKLWNGNITVKAVDDGIRGKDSVRIGDPDDLDYSTLQVKIQTNNSSTGGDGIKSTATESGKGYVTINGGSITIESYSDGIQAEQTFTMNGGTLDITTHGGAGETTSGDNTGGPGNHPWGGGMGGWGDSGNTNTTDVSAKGIKAVGLYDTAGTTYQSEGNLIVNGGTITLDTADDGLHCGGDMLLAGGTMAIATGDDGVHSDHKVTIGAEGATGVNSPKIEITKSYEGVEGVDIIQNCGTVLVTSSDDGYNAAGGTDNSGNTNPGGWGGGMMGGGNQTLTINGGYVYINASGDGLDSNGSLTVNGGYAFVSQTGGGNSPIDCDSTWGYNGGVVIAGGSSDMFSESIPATYQLVNRSASISAGTTVTITNSSGKIQGTMTFANSAAAIVVCAPESGTVYTGGTLSGVTYLPGSATNNNMKGGYGGTISGGTTMSSNNSGGNSGGWGF